MGDEPHGSLRFLLRPRWILFTLVVLALIVLMVNLGFWQLRRLEERREANDVTRSQLAAAPVPIAEVVAVDDGFEEARALEWRVVEATGVYDTEEQVLIRNRSFNGAPGEFVITPLLLSDGTALLVNRGWVPRAPGEGAGAPVPDPTEGPVTVVGRVRPTQERGSVGPRDAAEGELQELNRVDVARIRQQTLYALFPLYVELTDQAPPPGDFPRPVPGPELSSGPHLSYAIQWFTFSAMAVVAWVLVVRKSLVADRQRRTREARGPKVPASTVTEFRNVRPVPRSQLEGDGAEQEPAPAGPLDQPVTAAVDGDEPVVLPEPDPVVDTDPVDTDPVDTEPTAESEDVPPADPPTDR